MNLQEFVQSLSNEQKLVLLNILKHRTSFDSSSKLEELRFSNGLHCTKCGCTEDIVKFGTYKGKQRYICKSCGSVFTATTNTFLSSTKKDIEIWKQYIKCMVHKYSLRKSAEICSISLRTAFMWRHKILDALRNSVTQKLSGVIEADETFFRVSYKGSKPVGRNSRRRAGSNKRGLSTEQVCVPCAIERSDKTSYAKIGGLGKTSIETLKNVFENRIEEKSIICTDKEKSYLKFSKANSLEHIRLEAMKAKKGIYHIQNINGYHSRLKKFIDIFKGVSTKHLNNYLAWNNLIQEKSSKTSESGLLSEVLSLCFKNYGVSLYREICSRPAIPV